MDKKYLCEHCHTSSLRFEAEAFWDISKQEYKFNVVHIVGKAFCSACDNWVNYKEYEAEPIETGYSPLELNLEEFEKKDLINFILYAHKNNCTFNQAVVKCLEGAIKHYEVSN